MEMNYCRRCGNTLINTENGTYECSEGHTLFINSTPTVGIFFVTPDNQVLLSKRGIEPHKGMLDSFGGFVDGEETLEDAAERELKEELNLNPSDYEPLQFLCSGIGHYPYKGEDLPVLSTFFWSRLHDHAQPKPQDDVAAIETLSLKSLNLDLLHDDDIRIGIKALRALLL